MPQTQYNKTPETTRSDAPENQPQKTARSDHRTLPVMTYPQPRHHQWKSTANDHFHRWAEHYDRDIINMLLFEPTHQRILALIRQWHRQIRRKLRLLDIGCGTGTLIMKILQTHMPIQHLAGLDMSENMLKQAQQKILSVRDLITYQPELTLGDAEHLPFQDDAFDIVTCCHSFHHYPHKEKALAEMYRVLTPNGRLVIVDGSRDDPFGYFIFEVCVARVEKLVHHCTARELRKGLTQAGFQNIQQINFGICPPALLNIAYKK